MKQGKRCVLEIVFIGLPALPLMKVLTRLQAADADALVEIQSRAPPPLKSLLEATPEGSVFPKHARSICQQTLGKNVGSCLSCPVKRGRDKVRIGSALDCLSDESVEQFGDEMARVDTALLAHRTSGAMPNAPAEALSHVLIGIANVHFGSISCNR